MKITTDFECGGGKRIEQIGHNHWRIEANGDDSGYNKYFCVQVTSATDEPGGVLRLEVHPDSDVGEKWSGFLMTHFPSNIWYTHKGYGLAWYDQPNASEKWVRLRNTWEDSVIFHHDFVELRVPIEPGTEMYIATNPVLRYSYLLAWIDIMKARHESRLEVGSIGKSADGRDIPVLRLRGNKDGLPKIFVMAAQHPSEHGGNWACEGIVEYTLSSIAEAREIMDNFDLAVVPMINPDGNVRGLSGSNGEGINMFHDFKGAAAGKSPAAKEDRLLWDWLCSEFAPDVILHFHGYMGWKGCVDHPCDGAYMFRNPEKVYSDPERLAAYQGIQTRLMFHTPAYTSCSTGWLNDDNLEYQLATRFGTLSAFYEINTSSVGQFEQFRRGPQVLAAIVEAILHDVRYGF